MEITYSANGSTPNSETDANIKALAEHFEGRMYNFQGRIGGKSGMFFGGKRLSFLYASVII